MIRPLSTSPLVPTLPRRHFCSSLAPLQGVRLRARAGLERRTCSRARPSPSIPIAGANKGNGAGTVDRRYAQIQAHQCSARPIRAGRKDATRTHPRAASGAGICHAPVSHGAQGPDAGGERQTDPRWRTLSRHGHRNSESAPSLAIVVVLTDVKFDHNKIIFELNGGPDLKHRFLRHVQLGGGVAMNPVVQDDGKHATGARLTLEFKGHIPELTGTQVKALLAPLISFDVKTPIQAFTDTLPPKLKDAILDHNVMVGMTTDMVLFAMGQPERKVREDRRTDALRGVDLRRAPQARRVCPHQRQSRHPRRNRQSRRSRP